MSEGNVLAHVTDANDTADEEMAQLGEQKGALTLVLAKEADVSQLESSVTHKIGLTQNLTTTTSKALACIFHYLYI